MSIDVIEGVPYERIESPGCLLCGKLHPPRTIPVKFGMTVMVTECRECRIAYQTPRPALEASLAYMEMRWRSDDAYVANREEQSARAQKQLELMKGIVTTGSRLLDFGAGIGGFVRAAREGGWDAVGVERSQVAVERALRENAVRLKPELPRSEGEFDVITLWDVVEHLRDPIAVIESLRARLRPGGWMIFETGNWESWSRLAAADAWALYLFDHQYYFSPASLERILGRAGLVNFQLLPAEKCPAPNAPSPGDRADLFKRWLTYQRGSRLWPQHAAIDIMVAATRNP